MASWFFGGGSNGNESGGSVGPRHAKSKGGKSNAKDKPNAKVKGRRGSEPRGSTGGGRGPTGAAAGHGRWT